MASTLTSKGFGHCICVFVNFDIFQKSGRIDGGSTGSLRPGSSLPRLQFFGRLDEDVCHKEVDIVIFFLELLISLKRFGYIWDACQICSQVSMFSIMKPLRQVKSFHCLFLPCRRR